MKKIILPTDPNANQKTVTEWAVLDQQENGGNEAQNFLISVFYNSMTDELRELFVESEYQRSLIYIDMPFMDVKRTEDAVNAVNDYATQNTGSAVTSSELVGVASVTIEVNDLIVGSQWDSLLFALLFTIITLGIVFRDIRYDERGSSKNFRKIFYILRFML